MKKISLRAQNPTGGGRNVHLDSILNKRSAFTLAEVLITLGIIGVVAALTVPTLMMNINTKQWDTSASVFEKKLNESLKTMNTQQVIAGHPDTLSFVQELSKHYKINKICKNNELLDCFSETVMWGGGEATPTEVDMSIIKKAKNFGLNWETELIGVQFANGVAGLVAYNTECASDPYSNQFNGTGCVSILYDTSGAKNPNASGKDIGSYGTISKLGSACAFEVGSTCYATEPFLPAAVTKAECEELKSTHGINACYYENDYWAGAVKQCGGVEKLPTGAQLAEIANYMFNRTDISSGSYATKLTLDYDKVSSLGFDIASGSTFDVWAREENAARYAHDRYFASTYSYYDKLNRSYDYLYAICLD